METQLTPQQKALADLALKVRSNYESMNIGEIINRIHYISGRSMTKSIEGYKVLRREKLIPDTFVKELDKEKRYLELVSAPNVLELIERFGCTLGRALDLEASLTKPKKEALGIKQEDINFSAKTEAIQETKAAIERALSPNPGKNLIDRMGLTSDF